jgi:hypothetical protein
MTAAERPIHRDQRDRIRDEIEEIDADMLGWRERIRMRREQSAEARVRKVEHHRSFRPCSTLPKPCRTGHPTIP